MPMIQNNNNNISNKQNEKPSLYLVRNVLGNVIKKVIATKSEF